MTYELPPPAQMVLLLGGFRISQALYAAAALGVADHLVAGPASAEVLADRTGAHAPSLRRLLRTLASAPDRHAVFGHRGNSPVTNLRGAGYMA